MLPAPARLRARADFSTTVRAGRRGRSRLVMVYLRAPERAREPAAAGSNDVRPPTRAGFVVSRAVGPAVVRNRVKRRLRHLTGPMLLSLPRGSALVVRALPAAAGASYGQLDGALRRCLDQALVDRAAGRGARPSRAVTP